MYKRQGVYISMSGFTESLNVSVASSLTMHHATQDRRRRSPRNEAGNLSAREKETLRALYLAKLVPNYSRQGYLRQLLERAAAKEARGDEARFSLLKNETRADEEDAADAADAADAEIADEVALLNALDVAKIVKRPRKKKWGRPTRDDHSRIMSEVELADERDE